MRAWALWALLGAGAISAAPQPETFTTNGIRDLRSGAYALVGATVHSGPGETREDLTVYLRDGRIERVARGTPNSAASDHVVIDYSGLHLYAGFVDLNSGYGLPAPDRPAPFAWGAPQVLDSTTPGPYNANEAIKSHFDAVSQFNPDAKAAGNLRALGFGAVLSHRADGIARGSGSLLALIDGPAQEAVLIDRASSHHSLAKGSSRQFYPISVMGAVALLRQTHLDARWFQAQPQPPFSDRSLSAWIEQQSLPAFFSSRDWMDLLRGQAIAEEFDRRFIFLGSGDEYQRVQAVAATGAAVVVPLSFPKALPDNDPALLRMTDLATLQHWEQAPANAARLHAAGVRIAFTAAGLEGEQYKPFWPNLRQAIERGLPADAALAALTTTPAALIGQADALGRIAAGQHANLIVTSGPIDAADLVVHENWVLGQRHVLQAAAPDLRGQWTLSVAGQDYPLEISGSRNKPSAKSVGETPAFSKVVLEQSGERVVLRLVTADSEHRLAGLWQGDGRLQGYVEQAWQASRSGPLVSDAGAEDGSEDGFEAAAAETPAQPTNTVSFPLGAYGRSARPPQEHLLFTGATVWTSEEAGVLEDTDVRVRNGRIAEIGRDLAPQGARVIDASGRHLSAGIVDEHSHIAAASINDIATNSAMVRIADALDPTDINIFRNLAGGVTAVQILHGSANPIGGQSALIKLRWGVLPEELLIEDAPGFIKFALGENVKAASNPQSVRYPGTRMGVASFIDDAFAAAQRYRAEQAAWQALSPRQRERTPAPRRDLALQALVEILDGQRHISAHSYVQSEILMLMQLAERYGFRVNTFTHILEGYKLADRMAQHGAGASSFADWWAYKMEVEFAIPYNNALLEQAGVLSAINSDSDEMSRRLNQEAAKAIKYGGLSKEHALRLVTLHPARLLRLDDRMGSIRVGKDADLVLWSAEPLSIQAKADYTLVDGRIEYDRAAAEAAAAGIAAERDRLLLAMQAAAKGGAPTGMPAARPLRRFHCDHLTGYEYLIGGDHAH